MLFSLVMRNNGRCDIPNTALPRIERYSALKKVVKSTVPVILSSVNENQINMIFSLMFGRNLT